MQRIPERVSLEGLEDKWSARWEESGTYRYDPDPPREANYSIDTPPPTVSGSLHVGHVFSFTHTDTVARYQRMRGRNVFYPMGWDDNGLPTERRVENYYGVRCDPSLPYDPNFSPPERAGERPIRISRRNFVELCVALTAEDEKAFERLWRTLGLSVDWSLTYTTIGERAQRVSQLAFLRNLARGEAYSAEAPTLWDIDFQTAVAQAEVEDREVPGVYCRVAFPLKGGGRQVIETSRPELLAACVALVAHPDDPRYAGLLGAEAITPLYGVPVPIVGHELADPERGTGLAMICTFGDVTDITWWRDLQLPTRPVVGRDGRLTPVDWGSEAWPSRDPAAAEAHYSGLVGQTANSARTATIEMLREQGHLAGEPNPVTHSVKFYEKGRRPLEVVTSRQWYIKNGGRDPALRERLLERGRQLRWYPEYMRARYESWVAGLTGDWLISRQRFFGVPFPIWYPIDGTGRVDLQRPVVAEESRLPVDPSVDVPAGYMESDRGQAGGFVADSDVMDTWATSSLTPELVSGWLQDDERFQRLFPMDLRPQAHDIIRTWLFSSIVRAEHEFHTLPWTHAAISGWILDPDRKKMSKSKGNVVTPLGLLEQYGSDAVRYWAAGARPGADTAFDEGEMRVGRRLAVKLLNASRFVLSVTGSAGSEDPQDGTEEPTEAIDESMLRRLAEVVGDATSAFDEYDHARALRRTESTFWWFCDNYLELVKHRAYGSRGEGPARSASVTLRTCLSTFLRLFAPHMPFVTEEAWSWWREGSVHQAPWPEAGQVAPGAAAGPAVALDLVAEVLAEVRKAKTTARLSQVAPVDRVVVRGPRERLAGVRGAVEDLRHALAIRELDLEESAEPAVLVALPAATASDRA